MSDDLQVVLFVVATTSHPLTPNRPDLDRTVGHTVRGLRWTVRERSKDSMFLSSFPLESFEDSPSPPHSRVDHAVQVGRVGHGCGHATKNSKESNEEKFQGRHSFSSI